MYCDFFLFVELELW